MNLPDYRFECQSETTPGPDIAPDTLLVEIFQRALEIDRYFG